MRANVYVCTRVTCVYACVRVCTHLAPDKRLDEGSVELWFDRDSQLVLYQHGEVVLKVRPTVVLDDIVPTR